VDFALTAEQQLLAETSRRLLREQCPTSLVRAVRDDPDAARPLWEHLRGFAALGAGDLTDLCLFLESTGYASAPGPLLASALAGRLLAAAGAPEADDVAGGTVSATVALAGHDGTWVPNAEAVKTFVLEADRVDLVVVAHDGGRCAVVPVRDVPVRLVETVDWTRRICEVDTSGVDVGVALDPGTVRAWLDAAHAAAAAELVGTARRIFDMALSYAKERHQFGVPIGSFQAIQHKLAEMALLLERATAAVHYAAMTVDAAAPDRTRACHVAKAAAGEAARRCVRDGIQVHGGIGYTWEHDLHLFLRRATADGCLLGTSAWHHDRIADLLLA
jgi:alkylation response protein AidB-like acyl-CoA dehydrogenase